MVRLAAATAQPSDGEVKQTVENLLSADIDLGTADIRVSVDNGVVTLDGAVESFWKKRLADWMVCRARGVADLVNRITVVPTERIVDKSIAEAVRAAIERNANVAIDDVTITVEDRIVTLSGTVPTWSAREAARNAAALTRGVVDVIDDLGLRYPAMIGSVCEIERG
jgi:osmotically-inducible protein OsmY